MAIDDNASYELTGYQVKDLASKIRAKADSNSLASVATSGLYSDLTGAPTIPTVYNGTLTIQQNGTTLGTFSANQSTDETINVTGVDPTNYVTTSTDQSIAGEKTFVGNKRIKFKGSATNSKMGFTCYSNTNVETGWMESQGTTAAANKKMRLGIWDTSTGATDNDLGFQYRKGNSTYYNLYVAPGYNSPSESTHYIPVGFTDGNTTVESDRTGIVDLSTLLVLHLYASDMTGPNFQLATDTMLTQSVSYSDIASAFMSGKSVIIHDIGSASQTAPAVDNITTAVTSINQTDSYVFIGKFNNSVSGTPYLAWDGSTWSVAYAG